MMYREKLMLAAARVLWTNLMRCRCVSRLDRRRTRSCLRNLLTRKSDFLLAELCPVTALSGSLRNGRAARGIRGNRREVVFQSGGVVQLVRTPACHAAGRGFESRRSRQFFQASNART